MPTLHILIGLPGSGKSTWRAKHGGDAVVISSDDQIDAFAAAHGIGYDAAWGQVNHKDIKRHSRDRFEAAVREGRDIVVDMTNMRAKARRSWLAGVPASYRKVAVDFQIDDKELQRRLAERAARTGKVIPPFVVETMASRYDPPSREEGFDQIVEVRS